MKETDLIFIFCLCPLKGVFKVTRLHFLHIPRQILQRLRDEFRRLPAYDDGEDEHRDEGEDHDALHDGILLGDITERKEMIIGKIGKARMHIGGHIILSIDALILVPVPFFLIGRSDGPDFTIRILIEDLIPIGDDEIFVRGKIKGFLDQFVHINGYDQIAHLLELEILL